MNKNEYCPDWRIKEYSMETKSRVFKMCIFAWNQVTQIKSRKNSRETDRNVCRTQTTECGMSKAAKFQTHCPMEGSPWWWAEFSPTVWHSVALPQRQCRLSGWWVCSISEPNTLLWQQRRAAAAAVIVLHGKPSAVTCTLAFTTKQGCFSALSKQEKKKKKTTFCTEELQLAEIRCQAYNKLPVADWYRFNWFNLFISRCFT